MPFPIQTVSDETTTPPTTDIQKPSSVFCPSENIEEKTNIEEVSPIISDTVPKIDIEQTKIEDSSTLPIETKQFKKSKSKAKKTTDILSTIFHSNEQIPRAPALDLPQIDRNLPVNTPLYHLHGSNSDPLHIPSTNLPELDIPLPTYFRPEVSMTAGKTKRSSEFSAPTIDLTSTANSHSPENEKQPINLNSDPMITSTTELTDFRHRTNEQKDINLSQNQIESKVEQITQDVSIGTTIKASLAPVLPDEEMLNIQTDRKNFPIETDYAIKIETILPSLTSYEGERLVKADLSSIEPTIEALSELPLVIEVSFHISFYFESCSSDFFVAVYDYSE